MPYQFNPDAFPHTEVGSSVWVLTRQLLRERPILITDEEWARLSPVHQRHFVHVNRTYALNQTGAVHDRMRAEGQEQLANRVRADQDAVVQQLAQNARTPDWIRAAQEDIARASRRNLPLRPSSTLHSNEGDIEPEDL